MQGRAKVHEKQANRRSEKLGAAQSVHAWSRSTAYTVYCTLHLCTVEQKFKTASDRKECAASRLHVRARDERLHSASGLPRYLLVGM